LTAPSGVTTYQYSSNGLRTQRVDSSGTVNYLLDGSSVLAELDSVGTVAVRYLNNPQAIDDVFAHTASTGTTYPLTDGLGTVYALTDSAGVVVRSQNFDVYGERTSNTGAGPTTSRGFTGRWHDGNGLIEHRDRQRSPRQGTWLGPDRLGLGKDGPNLYSYVTANPVSFTDVTGFLTVDYDSLGQACGSGGGSQWGLGQRFRRGLTWALAMALAVDWDYAEMLYEDGNPPLVEFVPGGMLEGRKFAATMITVDRTANKLTSLGPIKVSTRVLEDKDIEFISHIIVHEVGHYAYWRSVVGKFLLPYQRARIENIEFEHDYNTYTHVPHLPTEGYAAERQVFGEIRDR
jgi:RHS repeat-associated protein